MVHILDCERSDKKLRKTGNFYAQPVFDKIDYVFFVIIQKSVNTYFI